MSSKGTCTAGAHPVSQAETLSIRNHSLTIDFVPVQEYEFMKANYNAIYQQDMLQVGQCDYDGVDTWLHAAHPLMKQPPWAHIDVSGECLEEIKEVGNLALVDSSRLDRAIRNSIYIPSLISKIDRCIANYRRETNAVLDKPIFCRTNECSMKQSTSYKVRPFTNGAEIMDQLLKDKRLVLWLVERNIKSTTMYLSDFDDTFATKNEYRVFVWRSRVTGISQYRWFGTDETEYHTEDSARQISEDIVRFVEGPVDGLVDRLRKHRREMKNIAAKENPRALDREGLSSIAAPSPSSTTAHQLKVNDNGNDDVIVLVADVVHTTKRVYLVEINLFGGETGCGSSLFHWKHDENILYGDGQDIVCRFLSRS